MQGLFVAVDDTTMRPDEESTARQQEETMIERKFLNYLLFALVSNYRTDYNTCDSIGDPLSITTNHEQQRLKYIFMATVVKDIQLT